MANYNKSFNFRNGVQVDEDDLIVRSSLVGIGTTIPRAELDVNGTVQVSGIVTTRRLYAGIATFGNVQIGTGITIDGNAGVIAATFEGNGAGLYNIPTSQWVDVNPDIFQYTSIYAAGNVGIGTTYPLYTLQIGGIGLSTSYYVGFNSTGSMYATGVVTASNFVGSGAGLTALNASNILTGTLDNSRLPSSIVVGLVSATNLTVGVATVGVLSATASYSGVSTIGFVNATNLYAGVGTVATFNATNATIGSATVSNLTGTAATITAVNSTSSTVGFLSATSAYVGLATVGFATLTQFAAGVGTITTLTSNQFNVGFTSASQIYVGVGTVLALNANNSVLGVATATNLVSGNIRVGKSASNTVDTSSGNLTLDSTGGTTTVDDDLSVTGATTIVGEATLNTGIVPDTDLGAYLGSNTKYFTSAYVGSIQIGAAATNIITTRDGDLRLDSNTSAVAVNAKLTVDEGITVTGTSYLTGITTAQNGVFPATDQGAPLGSNSLRFSALYTDNVTIGVGSDNKVSTGSGNLTLDSNSALVEVVDRFKVGGQTLLVGVTTVSNNLLPSSDRTGSLGANNKAFNTAYLGEVQVGASGSTIIDTRLGDLILDSFSNRVRVDQDLSVGNQIFVSNNALFGSNNSLSVLNASSYVGIGTSVPTSELQIRKSGNVVVEVISDTAEPTISIGQSVGQGNQSAQIRYDASSLEIVNNSTGSISNYIHAGSPGGIGTGRFSWIYGQSNTELLSLTHTGRLGIGITDPSHNLHVVGTSTVTGNCFTNDLFVNGTLFVNGSAMSGSGAIINANVYNNTGVSTLANLHILDDPLNAGISGISSIGIGTDKPTVGLDARYDAALFNRIGVNTDSLVGDIDVYTTGFIYVENNVGIGTTVMFDPNNDGQPGAVQLHNKSLGLFNGSVLIDGFGEIGVSTLYPRAKLDFGQVGTGASNSYMIIPTVNNTLRNAFVSVTKTGTASTAPGAIIFNSSTSKFQGYTGTGWVDFH